MTIEICRIKINALVLSIKSLLAQKEQYYDLPKQNYNKSEVESYLDRYYRLRDKLRELLPDYFDDLPMNTALVSNSSGWLHYTRTTLVNFHHDLCYCQKLLEDVSKPDSSQIVATRQGLFLRGQAFDAMLLIDSIVKDAKKSIDLIDGYIDGNLLDLFTGKKSGVLFKILTKKIGQAVHPIAKAFVSQHKDSEIRHIDHFHDRFLIIDGVDCYHFGASLKDVGSKVFMFSRIEEPLIVKSLLAEWAAIWPTAQKI